MANIGTDAIRREILTQLITNHGAKGRKVLVMKAKDKGVYTNYTSDNEVWEALVKFAEYHKLYIEKDKFLVTPDAPQEPYENIKDNPEEVPRIEELRARKRGRPPGTNKIQWLPDTDKDKPVREEDRQFVEVLQKERDSLETKLIAINKAIAVYTN